MDEVTQQNASLVEGTAAAGEALDEQVRELNTLMEFFKLVQDTSSLASHTSPPQAVEEGAPGHMVQAVQPWMPGLQNAHPPAGRSGKMRPSSNGRYPVGAIHDEEEAEGWSEFCMEGS
jgi:hypothetical protein